MKLPEPARTLYLRERELIAAWTAGAGLAPEQVALGGGVCWGLDGATGIPMMSMSWFRAGRRMLKC